MTAVNCMAAASSNVPRAPNVFTAGPAHAAPIANAPTFSDAAVVKICPISSRGVQR